MTEADQEREDEVLRRMLKAPPKPHKSSGKPGSDKSDPGRSRKKPD